MDDEIRIGARIERLRRSRGITQARFAAELRISPSYLNLIEHNRRRITVPLLLQIAQKLGVSPTELVENAEARLFGDLLEVFSNEALAESDVTRQDLEELVHSHAKFGKAMVLLFDRFDQMRRKLLLIEPMEEPDIASDAVSDFLQASRNHFPALEKAAQRVRDDMEPASEFFDQGLRAYLLNAFGLRWSQGAIASGSMTLSADRGELITSDNLTPETAAFLAARELGRLAAAQEIEDLLEASLLPEDALDIARTALASYFAAALIMPYEPFLKACGETRYDIERIGRRFRVSFEQVCRRMTTLQRPGHAGVPLHLIRTDIAGNISSRFSLSGLHIPRHSGACPRWNVYTTFMQPDQISVQLSQTPDGRRFFCIAKAMTKGSFRYNSPRRYLSIGLGCDVDHAGQMIYSDGFDLGSAGAAVPIGLGCRVCPRQDCDQRSHRAIVREGL